MDLLSEFLILDRNIHALHMQCAHKVLNKENIHMGQPPILKILLDCGECSQAEIADKLNISRASIGVSMKRMEKVGFITKETNEKDTRCNNVKLTEEGRNAALRSEQHLSDITAKKLEGFSEEETAQFIEYLKRMNKNMRNYRCELMEKCHCEDGN